MKSLLAAMSVALLLAGCGAQPHAVPLKPGQQALKVKAKQDRVEDITLKAKVVSVHGIGSEDGVLTATIEVLESVNPANGSHLTGRVKIGMYRSKNPGVDLFREVKNGATIQTSVPHVQIDPVTNKILPALNGTYLVSNTKVLQGK